MSAVGGCRVGPRRSPLVLRRWGGGLSEPDFGARTLSPRVRLLVTVITLRWSTRRAALASIMGTGQATLARAVRETTLDLTAIGKTIHKAPIKATTTEALQALLGQGTTPQK